MAYKKKDGSPMPPGRRSDGKFQKGVSGNPGGSINTGLKYPLTIEGLKTALRDVEIKKKKPFIRHFIEQAYDNPVLAKDVMAKILPTLKAVEHTGDVTLNRMSRDDVIDEIKKLLGN